jgi:hypothetical protein
VEEILRAAPEVIVRNKGEAAVGHPIAFSAYGGYDNKGAVRCLRFFVYGPGINHGSGKSDDSGFFASENFRILDAHFCDVGRRGVFPPPGACAAIGSAPHTREKKNAKEYADALKESPEIIHHKYTLRAVVKKRNIHRHTWGNKAYFSSFLIVGDIAAVVKAVVPLLRPHTYSSLIKPIRQNFLLISTPQRKLECFRFENALGRVNVIKFLFSGKEDASAMREYTLKRYLTGMADTI